MPRAFFHVTAELVVAVIDAVQAHRSAAEAQVVSFCDISDDQAKQALGLAVDLGLLNDSSGTYAAVSPLAIFAGAPGERQRSTMLRIALEAYDPFIRFRERLIATDSVDTAAAQTKQLLDLSSHREDVKDTLISLGTYTNAFKAEGSGRYSITNAGVSIQIQPLAGACADRVQAEQVVRSWIGDHTDEPDRNYVILPLARSLLKANAGEGREAVGEAGNAIESFLAELALRMRVDMTGASGINEKLNRFRTNENLPKKIVEAARYLGQVRNAADHGVDPDVGEQWSISELTGKTYPIVACAFICAALDHEQNGNYFI